METEELKRILDNSGTSSEEIGNIIALCRMTSELLEDRLQGTRFCKISRIEVRRLTDGFSQLDRITEDARVLGMRGQSDPKNALSLADPFFHDSANATVLRGPNVTLRVLLNLLKNSCEAILGLLMRSGSRN